MKKGLTLLFLLLAIIPLASAIDVTLTSPTDAQDFTDTNNVTFDCSTTGFGVSTITLYVDIDGTFAANHSESAESLSFEIKNIPAATYNWNCKAENGTAEAYATANRTFTVSHTPSSGGGTVTFSGTIANQTWDEDETSSNAFDLDDYFTGSSLTFEVYGNSSTIISIDSDNQVSLSADENWNGVETIIINATTGSSTASSNEIRLTVDAVNDAPTYSFIGNISIAKNANKTIDLSDYFTDPDGDDLNYSASDAANVDVTISGSDAILSPDTDWSGESSILFTATDGTASNTSNNITIKVASGNTAPSIDSYSPSSDPTINIGASQDFSITKSDADNDTLTVAWFLDNEIVSGQTGDSYTYSDATQGTHLVKVSVSDGTENTTRSWTVTVQEEGEATTNVTLEEELEVESILGEQTKKAECGNGEAEEGENCGNCPQDVKCAAGEICKDNVCTVKPSNTKPIIIIIVVIVILGAVGGAIYYFSTRNKQIPSTVTNVRRTSLPASRTGEQPAAEISDFYEKMKERRAKQKVEEPKEEPAKPVEPETPQISIPRSMKKYVKQMRKLNFSDDQIRKKLKEKGWSDAEISEAVKE